MKYSDFTIDQITFPIYEELSQKLLTLTKDDETRRKMERNIIRRRI